MGSKSRNNCCCGKLFLIIVNLIFFVLSLAVIVLGIISVAKAKLVLDGLEHIGVDPKDVFEVTGVDLEEMLRNTGIGMIVLGAVVGFISMFGLFGTCCGNKCCLSTYVVILTVIILLEVGIVIAAVVLTEKFHDTVSDAVLKVLRDSFKGDITLLNLGEGSIEFKNGDAVSTAWLKIQMDLECCGIRGPQVYEDARIDWKSTYLGAGVSNPAVPASCCVLNKDVKKIPFPTSTSDFVNLEECLRNETSTEISNMYRDGCLDTLIDYVDEYAMFVIIGAVALGVIELLLLISAVWACRNSKSENLV